MGIIWGHIQMPIYFIVTWEKRDSLLVTREEFITDLDQNYKEMMRFGIKRERAVYFLPPYEWYNKRIAEWTRDYGLQLINMTYGTLSHADYTTPEMLNYRSSDEIYRSILDFESKNTNGLNGFMLLMHQGTDPRTRRTNSTIVWKVLFLP